MSTAELSEARFSTNGWYYPADHERNDCTPAIGSMGSNDVN